MAGHRLVIQEMMSQGQTPKETHILQKKDMNKMGRYAAHLMNPMTLPKEDQAMSHLKTKKRAYCLKRQNESDDLLQSHSVRRRLTTRSDNEEIWDEITSEIDKIARNSDEAIRRAEEWHIEMQTSMAKIHQCINTLRERYVATANEVTTVTLHLR